MQYQCVFSKKKKTAKKQTHVFSDAHIHKQSHACTQPYSGGTAVIGCLITVRQRVCMCVCVCLCVCRGGGTFLCEREGCCNSRVKAREINTQKSYREYQTEKWACSLFVISELNVDLVIFICCLASNHPLLISLPLALYATSFHLSVLFHFLLPQFQNPPLLLIFSFLHPSCLSSCNPLSHLFV